MKLIFSIVLILTGISQAAPFLVAWDALRAVLTSADGKKFEDIAL